MACGRTLHRAGAHAAASRQLCTPAVVAARGSVYQRGNDRLPGPHRCGQDVDCPGGKIYGAAAAGRHGGHPHAAFQGTPLRAHHARRVADPHCTRGTQPARTDGSPWQPRAVHPEAHRAGLRHRALQRPERPRQRALAAGVALAVGVVALRVALS